MNEIIKRLSEVEAAASSVAEDAAAKKKDMARTQAERIAAFEDEAHRETARRLKSMQEHLEESIAKELDAQKAALQTQLSKMDRMYEENHTSIAKKLLEQIAAQ